MYEPPFIEPISRWRFARRMLRHIGSGFVIVIVSGLIGMIGFHCAVDEPWDDAALNAAMLLGGMGPVGNLSEPAKIGVPGKVFAIFFALYSGLVFISVTSLLAAPVFHRVLHRFHWEGRDQKKPK
jgi:hypothetical protein